MNVGFGLKFVEFLCNPVQNHQIGRYRHHVVHVYRWFGERNLMV